MLKLNNRRPSTRVIARNEATDQRELIDTHEKQKSSINNLQTIQSEEDGVELA
jgi:hypothetical protein